MTHTADDQAQEFFSAPQYQTASSPIYRSVWDRDVPVELFTSSDEDTPADCSHVMDQSFDITRRHRTAGTLWNPDRQIEEHVLNELGRAGYWGLLIDKQYGGSGASFRAFTAFLTRMATADPTVAGLVSIHSCIGAVNSIRTFGNTQQKQRFLPRLASGESLSAFALTEPNAGSDLTALRTRAELAGDHYVVNGEKLFVTNAAPGRTIGLVCLIHERPAILVCDLPQAEDAHFQLKRYGLWALKHALNHGIIFRDFKVPAENYLAPPRGNGLTIAYHGLNRGRISLCATAAGHMRRMLASMVSWAEFRTTYGETISRRQLVRRRLGRMAALIVACDALAQWCSGLIDRGFRGEMEGIVAKIFAGESLKEAAVELLMRTHGGRSFLHGHLFGDNVHEYLAPCVYEGEGEMLGLAFFRSLVKKRAAESAEAMSLSRPSGPAERNSPTATHPPSLPRMPVPLLRHAQMACDQLQAARLEIERARRRPDWDFAGPQCRMAEISGRIQSCIVMLVTSLYASRSDDRVIQQAADVLGQDLTQQLTGKRPSDEYFQSITSLGEVVVEGGFKPISGLPADDILMPYDHE